MYVAAYTCTRFYYKQRFFFNSVSVLLNVLVNLASNDA